MNNKTANDGDSWSFASEPGNENTRDEPFKSKRSVDVSREKVNGKLNHTRSVGNASQKNVFIDLSSVAKAPKNGSVNEKPNINLP